MGALSNPLPVRTLQDVTASRASGTLYTNNTGREIEVSVKFANSTTASGVITATVDGMAAPAGWGANGSGLSGGGLSFTVPNGKTYKVDMVWNTGSNAYTWLELR